MTKQSQRSTTPTAVPVLLTRPLEQSVRFASAVVTRFGPQVRVVLSPLMNPVFLAPQIPPGEFSAVLFTSEVAVDAARLLQGAGKVLPRQAICVGARTAQAARDAGFLAQSAQGDVDALLNMVIAAKIVGPLLYLRGRETRGDLAERLNSAGIETVSALVYQQVPQPLSAEALTTLADFGPVIVPVFSPRSAEILSQSLAADRHATVLIAAMSAAVAQAALSINPHHMVIAARPDADAMLDALELLLITARGS